MKSFRGGAGATDGPKNATWFLVDPNLRGELFIKATALEIINWELSSPPGLRPGRPREMPRDLRHVQDPLGRASTARAWDMALGLSDELGLAKLASP